MAKAILTVDDSPSIRQLVTFTLKAAGYEVHEAASADAALKLVGIRQFDLILTDQNMPGMDGLSLVQRLRSSPGYKSTPILLLTTESGDEAKSKGRQAGATGWIVKPFNAQKLTEIVSKLLG